MRTKFGKWTLEGYALVMLAVMLVIILVYPMRMNRDAAVFVQFSDRLLAGEQMWQDFFVVNFPMVFYISAVPAFFANVTGLPVPLTFQLFVWVVVLASAGMVWWLVHRYFFEGEYQSVTSIVPAVIVGFSFYLLTHPDYASMDFGQREHLFILLLLPAFITRWLHWQGKRVPVVLAVVLGMLAAMGTVIKPQFLALVGMPELYWFITRRQWKPLVKPEVFGFVGLSIVYVGWLFVMPGSDYFLGYMFPTFFPKYNSCAWYCETTVEMFQRQGILAVVLLLPLEWAVFRGKIPQNSFYTLLPALSMMRLGALIANVAQQKGLHYRAVPMFLLLWVTIALLAAFVMGRGKAGRFPVAWQYGGAFIVLQLVLLYNFLTVIGTISITDVPRAWTLPPDLDLYETVLEFSDEGDTVAFLTLDPALAHWMTLNTERVLLSRYSAEYPISFEYIGTTYAPEDDIPILATVEDYVETLREDITQQQPPLLLIEREREDRYPNIADILDVADFPAVFEETGYVQLDGVSGYDVWVHTDHQISG